MSRKIFDYESFPGAAGTDITAIAPTSSDSAAPHYTVTSGSFKADGNGGLMVPGPGNAKGLMPSPSSGQFDATMVVTSLASGNNIWGFYVEQDTSTYYIAVEGQYLTIRKLGGGGTADMADASSLITTNPTAPFTLTVQKRISGSSATLVATLNGTVYPTSTDIHPNLASVPSAASLICGAGGYTLTSFAVTDPAGSVAPVAPTTVTLAGPTSGPSGSESAAFTATLDHPAPTGGTTVNLASTGSGDVFHATAGGSAVAAVTIPAGGTSATFLLVPAAAGNSSVSITAAGLTVAGSPVAYTASAPTNPAAASNVHLLLSTPVTVGIQETIYAVLVGGAALANDLVITLTGSNLTLPLTTVTIPAGQFFAFFPGTPTGGPVAVSGTATGFTVTGDSYSTPGTPTDLAAVLTAIGNLPAPYTPAENAAFWAARDAADPTAAEAALAAALVTAQTASSTYLNAVANGVLTVLKTDPLFVAQNDFLRGTWHYTSSQTSTDVLTAPTSASWTVYTHPGGGEAFRFPSTGGKTQIVYPS